MGALFKQPVSKGGRILNLRQGGNEQMTRKTITSILVLFFVLLFTVSAFAYVKEEWTVRYNENEASYASGKAVFVDSSDFIYVFGTIYKTTAYEPIIIKFDGSGNVIWERLLSGKGGANLWGTYRGAAMDQWDNIIVGGSAGASGAFILKMDAQGATLWERTSTATGSFFDIKVDPDGNLLAMGTSAIAKYSPDGTLIWEKNTEGTSFSSVATDPAGNVHLSGSSKYMGADTPTLWSYDANGNHRFTAYGDSTTHNSYNFVNADADGNVIATATYWSVSKFDKYDTYGNLIWSRAYNKTRAQDVKVDTDGSVLVGGSVYGYYGWPEFGVYKYSPAGDLLWKRSYYRYGDSSVYGIHVGDDGSVYATGELGYCPGTMRTMKFGPNGEYGWAFDKYIKWACASINYGYGVNLDSQGNAYATGHTTYPASPWGRKLTLIKYSQSCSGKPTINITSYGPMTLWPPDHKEQDITVTGKVTLPSNCTLVDASYSIFDEYGDYTSEGSLSIDAYGNFSLTVPLEAWRDGNDKDGRNYSISISVTDEAGTTGTAYGTVVPHDKSK